MLAAHLLEHPSAEAMHSTLGTNACGKRQPRLLTTDGEDVPHSPHCWSLIDAACQKTAVYRQ